MTCSCANCKEYSKMTDLPLMRCLQPGCRAMVPRGYCLAHTKERSKKHQQKDYQKLYNNRQWMEASLAFRRANPLCKSCESKGLVVASAVTDHIVSIADGGNFWDKSNWQALCLSCHNSKTRQEQNKRQR